MDDILSNNELNLDELFNVTGGINSTGESFFRSTVIQYKRNGRSKEYLMERLDQLGRPILKHYDTSRRELTAFIDKTWDETEV